MWVKVTLLIIGLFFSAGCERKSSSSVIDGPTSQPIQNNPLPPMGQNALGGISGGGGNSVDTRGVAPDRIAWAAEDSKGFILAWANSAEYQYRSGQSAFPAISTLLFDQPITVFDILEDLEVEVRLTDSCRDQDGHEVDGSAVSQFANAICISAHRLAPKLSSTDYRIQIRALILHEVSHLLGTTEPQAIKLQQSLVSGFHAPGGYGWQTPIQAIYHELRKFEYKPFFFWPAGNYNSAGKCSEAKTLKNELYRLFYEVKYDSSILFLRAHSYDSFKNLYVKWDGLTQATCLQDPHTSPTDRVIIERQYDRAFLYQSSTTTLDYAERHFIGLEFTKIQAPLVIRKIENREIYNEETHEIAKILESVREELLHLSQSEFTVIEVP